MINQPYAYVAKFYNRTPTVGGKVRIRGGTRTGEVMPPHQGVPGLVAVRLDGIDHNLLIHPHDLDYLHSEPKVMTFDDFMSILEDIHHPGLTIEVIDAATHLYLQVRCDEGVCNVTGKPLGWKGRKWLLSKHMTRGEVVQTAFKAVMTAMEHETREQFKYRGQAIFDPHYDVDRLAELRASEGAIQERVAA